MKIRPIENDDLPAVVLLLREFAREEGLSEYCEVTVERLEAVMFGRRAFVEGLLAVVDGGPVGYALFYPHFSSFRGQPGLYLEDIYIAGAYRGQGIGKALLRAIAAIARDRGHERIDFQVLEQNQGAVRFYENLGAVRDADERHFKFTDRSFTSLADKIEGE